MGEMTTSIGRTPADVRGWPPDPAARQALMEYLEELPRDSEDVPQGFYGAGMDFTGADLSGLDLSEADFMEARLGGVRMEGADLFGAWFNAATLSGADLSGCLLRKAQGRGCDARGASLRGANLDRAEFEDADFRGADLSRVVFAGAWMHSADLRDADLRECRFGGAPGPTGLVQVRLAGSRLTGATGRVSGPVDIGADSPHLIDGDELRDWFASQGAPLVEVTTPTS